MRIQGRADMNIGFLAPNPQSLMNRTESVLVFRFPEKRNLQVLMIQNGLLHCRMKSRAVVIAL